MGKIIIRGRDYSGGDLTSVSLWSSTVTYNKDDLVLHNVIVYRALRDSINQEPSSTSTYWVATTVGDVMNALNAKLQSATYDTLGVVKPDGSTITIDTDGTLHGVENTPIATADVAGKVKPDGTTITVAEDGTITSTASAEIVTAIEALDATVSTADGSDVSVTVVETDGKLASVTATFDKQLGTAADADVATTPIAQESTDNSLVTAAQVSTFVKAAVADLEGVMHFKGVVQREGTETDIEAITRAVTDPKAGDLVVMSDNGKEYVYSGAAWIELGDEGLFVKKSQTIAGIDQEDAITAAELKTALGIDNIETAIGTTTSGSLYSVSDRIKAEAKDGTYTGSVTGYVLNGGGSGELHQGEISEVVYRTINQLALEETTSFTMDELRVYTPDGVQYSTVHNLTMTLVKRDFPGTNKIGQYSWTRTGGGGTGWLYSVEPVGTVVTIADMLGSLETSQSESDTRIDAVEATAGYYIKNTTIPTGSTTYTITSDKIKADSIIDISYSDSSMTYAQSCDISYSQAAGSLTLTFASATTTPITVDYIHVVN